MQKTAARDKHWLIIDIGRGLHSSLLPVEPS